MKKIEGYKGLIHAGIVLTTMNPGIFVKILKVIISIM